MVVMMMGKDTKERERTIEAQDEYDSDSVRPEKRDGLPGTLAKHDQFSTLISSPLGGV